MLPKLRIILAAVIATCAAVLALSGGMLATHDPANKLSGVPDVNRTLVRQAIVEEPESQQSQVLAYSRRADELLRLRDLPATPVRAVVEYAEQAHAKARESAAQSATPVAAAPAAAAAAPMPPASGAAVATPAGDTRPPVAVAMAPVATPPAETSAAVAPPVTAAVAAAPATERATVIAIAPASPPAVEVPPVAPPADATATPVAAPAQAPAASAPTPAARDTHVAAVQAGASETAEMYGPEKPKAKPRHRPKAAHKPKPQVAQPARTVAPAAATGFPFGAQTNPNSTLPNSTLPNSRPNTTLQNGRQNTFGTWRTIINGTTATSTTTPTTTTR